MTENGTTEASAMPVQAGKITGATWIATGVNNSCAVIAQGEIYCWGTDDQRGDGIIVKSNVPRRYNQSRDAVKVVNGRNFFCALTTAGKVVCFGSNIMMQLGSMEAGNKYTEAQPKDITKALDIGAGGFFACAVMPSKNVLCWGIPPGSGELNFEGSEAKRIVGLSNVQSISLGLNIACAVIETDGVKCWGNNAKGQLGNGVTSTDEVATPVDVIGLPGEDKAVSAFRQATAFLSTDDYPVAIEMADKALSLQPGHVGALLIRGQALFGMGKLDGAILDFNDVILKEPSNPDAYYSRGIAFAEQGKSDEAIADFSRVIQLRPRDADAYGERAWAYQLQKSNDLAKADLAEAIKLNPAYSESLDSRAFRHNLKDQHKRAIEDYTRALTLDPNIQSAYRYRADSYRKLGNFAEAVKDLDKLIELDNGGFNYLSRSEVYADMGDFKLALVDINSAITTDPASSYFISRRADLYLKMGDKQKALSDYDGAIKLEPASASSWLSRGDFYRAEGKFEKALADYSKAIEIAPHSEWDYESALVSRALLYHQMGEFDKSIADYVALQAEVPNQKNYGQIARIRATKGDFAAAITDFNKAISMEPDAGPYYADRGVMQFVLGNTAPALADLERAAELDVPYFYMKGAIWLDIVQRRNNRPSTLGTKTSELNLTEWPGPIVSMMRGDITQEDAFAAASAGDPQYMKGQLCEVRFFAGEKAFLEGRKDAAADLLRLAAKECPLDYVERSIAIHELGALKVMP